MLTGIFLGLAALIAAGTSAGGGRGPSPWRWWSGSSWSCCSTLAALGVASLLRSGAASRLLIIAAMVNPVDAVRTAALLAIEGTAAFGAASLALLRFTGGPARAACCSRARWPSGWWCRLAGGAPPLARRHLTPPSNAPRRRNAAQYLKR